MRAWLDRQLGKVPPKSLTGKALSYLASEWGRLTQFLSNGAVPISNAMAENAIRPLALGRKNWLFSDTAAGAESSAIIFSVIETVKANGLEPWKYLRFVLGALPLCKTVGDFERLLPYNCNATDTLLL